LGATAGLLKDRIIDVVFKGDRELLLPKFAPTLRRSNDGSLAGLSTVWGLGLCPRLRNHLGFKLASTRLCGFVLQGRKICLSHIRGHLLGLNNLAKLIELSLLDHVAEVLVLNDPSLLYSGGVGDPLDLLPPSGKIAFSRFRLIFKQAEVGGIGNTLLGGVEVLDRDFLSCSQDVVSKRFSHQ
jgi:hypothetical protein